MSAKKRSDSDSTVVEMGNPFEPNMDALNPEFNLTELIEQCKKKQAEGDKRKIGIQERVRKAKENIARIQNMITGLETKSQQELGAAYMNQVIRPVMDELQKVFPNTKMDLSGPYGMSGDITLTLTSRMTPVGKKAETKCITFSPLEDAVGYRNFRERLERVEPRKYPADQQLESQGRKDSDGETNRVHR